jgi:arylsulfatase
MQKFVFSSAPKRPFHRGVNPAVQPFAERLRNKGYATAAIIANPVLMTIPGLTRGFDSVHTLSHLDMTPDTYLKYTPLLVGVLREAFARFRRVRPKDTTDEVSWLIRSFLDRHSDRPFFLYVHYVDPHAPYDPPEAFRTSVGRWPFVHPYAGNKRYGIRREDMDDINDKADRNYISSLYTGEIGYLDEHLGKLLGWLDAHSIRDQTYICFTADHGEEFWDHGKWGHGHALYEEEIRVPLILEGPTIVARREAARISAIDVLPTLAGLVHLSHDPAWQGRDLSATLSSPSLHPAETPIYFHSTTDLCQEGMILGDLKLVRDTGKQKLWLFDVAADPRETTNLVDRNPSEVRTREEFLDAWLATIDDSHALGEADQKKMEQVLKAVGYI